MIVGAKNPRETKAIANRCHAQARARERYGLTLRHRDLIAIEEKINQGSPDCAPLRPDRNFGRRTWYAVKVDGHWYPVVFDKATSSLMTFLPEHTIADFQHVLPVDEPTKRPKRTVVIHDGGLSREVFLEPLTVPDKDPTIPWRLAPSRELECAIGQWKAFARVVQAVADQTGEEQPEAKWAAAVIGELKRRYRASLARESNG